MKKIFFIAIAVIVIVASLLMWWRINRDTSSPVTNFEQCVAEGNLVMESYPRQCISDNGDHFTENIGNEFEKNDFVRVDSPRPNASISSPLIITGQARGNWFFEASFPVFLIDWDGKKIAQGIATAKGDWMTTDFVPFEATLTFTIDQNTYNNKGSLILKKDNPSGLPANDDALEIPVEIIGAGQPLVSPVACAMDAKLCPDGSYVGRTGPNCEFAACPTVTSRAIQLYYYNPEKDKDDFGNIKCSAAGLVGVNRELATSLTPIQDTVKLLLRGELSNTEKANGLTTEFPLAGLELKSALLNNGSLILNFSDQNNQTSGGSCRSAILWAQISKTVKQFPEVQSVKFSPDDLFQP